MKNIVSIIFVFLFFAFSSNLFAQHQNYEYAYISVEGRLFSKKLKVVVDLGETPEQIKNGEKYSELLSGKKSYAAILNFLVESQFELIETIVLQEGSSYQGTGSSGTSGVVFIMRKKK
jgi:hypothetical protein